MNFRPRRNWLIVRAETVAQLATGIAVSQRSAEGIRHIVVAKGPDVRPDIPLGAQVVIGGPIAGNQNLFLIYQIPGTKDLFNVQDENVLNVVEKE